MMDHNKPTPEYGGYGTLHQPGTVTASTGQPVHCSALLCSGMAMYYYQRL